MGKAKKGKKISAASNIETQQSSISIEANGLSPRTRPLLPTQPYVRLATQSRKKRVLPPVSHAAQSNPSTVGNHNHASAHLQPLRFRWYKRYYEKKSQRWATVYNLPAYMNKYFRNRFLFFSRFSEGVILDDEGWFSVTPESIAAHIARRCAGRTVLDAFAGCGGNAIQFALAGCQVIAVELDAQRLSICRKNAEVYGVEDRIRFVHGDVLTFLHCLRADVVFLAPPWGGIDYDEDAFDLEDAMPINGVALYRHALHVSRNIAYYLPRKTPRKHIAALASLSPCPCAGDCMGLLASGQPRAQWQWSGFAASLPPLSPYNSRASTDADAPQRDSGVCEDERAPSVASTAALPLADGFDAQSASIPRDLEHICADLVLAHLHGTELDQYRALCATGACTGCMIGTDTAIKPTAEGWPCLCAPTPPTTPAVAGPPHASATGVGLLLHGDCACRSYDTSDLRDNEWYVPTEAYSGVFAVDGLWSTASTSNVVAAAAPASHSMLGTQVAHADEPADATEPLAHDVSLTNSAEDELPASGVDPQNTETPLVVETASSATAAMMVDTETATTASAGALVLCAPQSDADLGVAETAADAASETQASVAEGGEEGDDERMGVISCTADDVAEPRTGALAFCDRVTGSLVQALCRGYNPVAQAHVRRLLQMKVSESCATAGEGVRQSTETVSEATSGAVDLPVNDRVAARAYGALAGSGMGVCWQSSSTLEDSSVCGSGGPPPVPVGVTQDQYAQDFTPSSCRCAGDIAASSTAPSTAEGQVSVVRVRRRDSEDSGYSVDFLNAPPQPWLWMSAATTAMQHLCSSPDLNVASMSPIPTTPAQMLLPGEAYAAAACECAPITDGIVVLPGPDASSRSAKRARGRRQSRTRHASALGGNIRTGGGALCMLPEDGVCDDQFVDLPLWAVLNAPLATSQGRPWQAHTLRHEQYTRTTCLKDSCASPSMSGVSGADSVDVSSDAVESVAENPARPLTGPSNPNDEAGGVAEEHVALTPTPTSASFDGTCNAPTADTMAYTDPSADAGLHQQTSLALTDSDPHADPAAACPGPVTVAELLPTAHMAPPPRSSCFTRIGRDVRAAQIKTTFFLSLLQHRFPTLYAYVVLGPVDNDGNHRWPVHAAACHSSSYASVRQEDLESPWERLQTVLQQPYMAALASDLGMIATAVTDNLSGTHKYAQLVSPASYREHNRQLLKRVAEARAQHGCAPYALILPGPPDMPFACSAHLHLPLPEPCPEAETAQPPASAAAGELSSAETASVGPSAGAPLAEPHTTTIPRGGSGDEQQPARYADWRRYCVEVEACGAMGVVKALVAYFGDLIRSPQVRLSD